MADEFSNDPLPVDGLPRLSDDAFVGVDPRHLRPGLAALGVVVVGILIGSGVVAANVDPAWPAIAIGAGAAAVVVLGIVLTVVEGRRLAYQLREHDISYRSGAIGRRVATIPFARVQHVSVSRGPIERWLGLATLGINSAGPDLSIPGLAPDDADRIKQFIVDRSDATDDDVDASPATPTPPVLGSAVPGPPLPPPTTGLAAPATPPAPPPTTPPGPPAAPPAP